MVMRSSSDAKNSNGSLFKILFFSILAGFAIIFSLLHFYGRGYDSTQLDRVLISPDSLKNLSFNELDGVSGRKIPYIFDKITTSPSSSLNKKELNHDAYVFLYEEIKKDRAIAIVSEQIKQAFSNSQNYVAIHLMVKPKESLLTKNYPEISFQEIQILDDGLLYRISARQEGVHEKWVYFRHPKGLKTILDEIGE